MRVGAVLPWLRLRLGRPPRFRALSRLRRAPRDQSSGGTAATTSAMIAPFGQ